MMTDEKKKKGKSVKKEKTEEGYEERGRDFVVKIYTPALIKPSS